MEKSHIAQCKLRNAAFTAVDCLIYTLQHQPGGYTFWANLPQKGRHNAVALRKTFTNILLTSLFPSSFLTVLLKSVFTDNGQPLNVPLYKWLLGNVYCGSVKKMYIDWVLRK